MKTARTEHFKRAWQNLTTEQKKSGKKAIERLADDLRYPALRVRKIKGTADIWEARASRSLRFTFRVEGKIIILRYIGPHDETLERP